MICISLANLSFYKICKIVKNTNYLYELRLDLLNLNINQVLKIIKLNNKLIITDRNKKLSQISPLLKTNLKYIDIDYRSIDIPINNKISNKLIISYHNYNKTPKNLVRILKMLKKNKAKIYKISTYTNSYLDVCNLLKLKEENKDLIIQAMGEKGKILRIVTDFSYAYYSTPSASGQIHYKKLEKIKSLI